MVLVCFIHSPHDQIGHTMHTTVFIDDLHGFRHISCNSTTLSMLHHGSAGIEMQSQHHAIIMVSGWTHCQAWFELPNSREDDTCAVHSCETNSYKSCKAGHNVPQVSCAICISQHYTKCFCRCMYKCTTCVCLSQ